MQAKLGAGFLLVALLWLVVGLVVPRLGLNSVSSVTLTASAYVAVALSAAWLISRWINRRVRQLAAAAAVVSRGDLTHRISRPTGHDEISELTRSFATMTDNLLRVVCEVRAVAGRVRDSSRALSDSSEEMRVRTEEIAAGSRAASMGAEEQVG